jgi:hypothetical protein
VAVTSRRRKIRYYQQLLIPTVDPKIFNTTLPFIHTDLEKESVHYAGQILFCEKDYVVDKSAGPSGKYDIIELLFTPRAVTNWWVDFAPDL